MNKSPYLDNYIKTLDDLLALVKTTNQRVLQEDEFFTQHINFYTKSFMVLMCTYLESYLKDILMWVFDNMNERLKNAKVPHNLVKWSLNPKQEWTEKDEKFSIFLLEIDKNGRNRTALDDFISGMPYRTEPIFRKFGMNLWENEIYREQKNGISQMVQKRNHITHHNDDASDIAFTDVLKNIELIKNYISNIDGIVVVFLSP
jgi:hypothetical protein